MPSRSRELRKRKSCRWVSSRGSTVSNCVSSNSCRWMQKGIGSRTRSFPEPHPAHLEEAIMPLVPVDRPDPSQPAMDFDLPMGVGRSVSLIRSASRFVATAIVCESLPMESCETVLFSTTEWDRAVACAAVPAMRNWCNSCGIASPRKSQAMASILRSSSNPNEPCIRLAAEVAVDTRIYLDNAATSWPKPEAVYDAVDRYQRTLGAPRVAGVSRSGRSRTAGSRGAANDRSAARRTGFETHYLRVERHRRVEPGHQRHSSSMAITLSRR